MSDEPNIHPEARIIHGLHAILGGVNAIGAEAARDTLTAHMDMIAEDMDQDTDTMEVLLINLISEAIRTADDAMHGRNRSITIRDLDRDSMVHLCWRDGDGEPHSETFTGAVLSATRHALGLPHETAAARDVLAERRRQIEDEGWTPEHDDAHIGGELASVAACYASPTRDQGIALSLLWPPTWSRRWWRRAGSRRLDLVTAGALILAEIERLDRMAERTGE